MHKKIVITGAAGFIASGWFSYFIENIGGRKVVIVDDFGKKEKTKNLAGKIFDIKIDRKLFTSFMQDDNSENIDFVFHLGARTDTTEMSTEIFDELNIGYSKKVWNFCVKNQIPLVYASSAATYGDGTLGFDDDHEVIQHLKPLNPYGVSKNEFDKWVLNQRETPPHWMGLKFFNVYGPNEYHKGRMASVMMHAYRQILNSGKLNLFRSHNKDYEDGGQMRDFIYVNDIFKVLEFLYTNHQNLENGIYNLGTGKARTFVDLGRAIFTSMSIEPNIAFIDTPEDIRDKYQYFTEANMQKLVAQGFDESFTTLEDGVHDYVKRYLIPNKYM